MLLYGNDMDETTTLVEAGLGWTLSFDEAKGDWNGRSVLLEQKTKGAPRKLVGFEITERGIARHGYPVFVGDDPAGAVTSGSYAPFLQKSIGLAYLPAARRRRRDRARGRDPRPPRRAPASCRRRSTSARAKEAVMYPRGLPLHERPRVDRGRRRPRQGRHHGLRPEAARGRGVRGAAGGRAQAAAGERFGTVESVKAVSELYLAGRGRGGRGERAARRQARDDQPGPARRRPGWWSSSSPARRGRGALMDAAAYDGARRERGQVRRSWRLSKPPAASRVRLEPPADFPRRHVGPDDAEIEAMLARARHGARSTS